MLVKLRLLNWIVLVVVLFFVYLGALVLRPANTMVGNDVVVDLKELMKLCMIGVLHAADLSRKWHASGVQSLSSLAAVSDDIIASTVQRFPAVRMVHRRSAGDLLPTVHRSVRTNYFALWWKYRTLMDQLPSLPVSANDISVWISALDAPSNSAQFVHSTISLCIAVSDRPAFGIISRPIDQQTVWGLIGHICHPNCTTLAVDSTNPTDSAVLNGTVLVYNDNNVATNAESAVRSAFGAHWSIESQGDVGYGALRLLNGSADFFLHTDSVEKRHLCAMDAILQSAGGHFTTLTGVELLYAADDGGQLYESNGFLASVHHHFYYVSKILPTLHAVGS